MSKGTYTKWLSHRDSNSDLADSRFPILTKDLVPERKNTPLLQEDNEEQNGIG